MDITSQGMACRQSLSDPGTLGHAGQLVDSNMHGKQDNHLKAGWPAPPHAADPAGCRCQKYSGRAGAEKPQVPAGPAALTAAVGHKLAWEMPPARMVQHDLQAQGLW